MVEASGGLLADSNTAETRLLTARGSHTVASLRCILYGATGIHQELCDSDGRISMPKVLELQPTIKAPLDVGVPVDIIDDGLVLACPRLMATLSRVDNAHAVGRQQTALQMCSRLTEVLSQYPNADREFVVKRAAIGMTTEQQVSMRSLLPFAGNWSGGANREIIRELEGYEKSLTVKRRLPLSALEAYAAVNPIDLEQVVPAMVKAMLNTPMEYVDEQGLSMLFSKSEIKTIAAPGKTRTMAIQANQLMVSARKFITAYGRMPLADRNKIIAELEVKVVMHLFGKKSATRQQYASFTEIAASFYDAAKAVDAALPPWSKLENIQRKALASSSAAAAPDHAVTLREIRTDGTIPASELARIGFKPDVLVTKPRMDDKDYDDEEADKFVIVSICESKQEVAMKPHIEENNEDEDDEAEDDEDEEEKEEAVEVTASFRDLITAYRVYKKPEAEFYVISKMNMNVDEVAGDIVKGIYIGYVKGAMHSAYVKLSCDESVVIHKKPAHCVEVKTSYRNGAFTLVGISNNVNITNSKQHVTGTKKVTGTLVWDNGDLRAVVRPHVQWPITRVITDSKAKTAASAFLPAYWHVQTTCDADKVNCRKDAHEVTVKLSSSSRSDGPPTDNITIRVPIIVNTKAVKPGDELLMAESDVEEDEDEDLHARPDKKARTDAKVGEANAKAGDGVAQAKSKAKGRGKGRGGRGRGSR